jgi:Uma2 family endonuclease
MTQALKMSFEEYLSLEVGSLPEGQFEYVEGELRDLPPESEPNDFIANYLMFVLASSGVIPLRLIRPHSCEVEVPVLQAGDPRTRIPDLVILRPEHLTLTQKRLTITRQMPPPVLIAEVVSPGDANRKRDYERKREQYQELGVLEYWLIDPDLQSITVLELQAGTYAEVGSFRGGKQIISRVFPALSLTAEQVLIAG